MKRISWLLFVPLGLAAAAVPVACIEFDSYEIEPKNNGGMGNVSTSTGMMASVGGMGGTGGTGGSGGGPQCMNAMDCPNYECRVRGCTDGVCVWTNLPDNTALDSQFYGDCKERVCDGMGGVRLIDSDVSTDSYTWGNPCYKKACNATVQPEANDGADCVTAWGKPGKCDMFECFECPGATDCGTGACINRRCVIQECNNQMTDGNETSQDCGGPDCAPCGAGAACMTHSDCGGSCDASDDASVQCVDPTCADGVQNGNETDIDCGGSCAMNDPLKKCPDPKKCLYPKDCISGVCQGGECKPSSCKDQVKNQDETGLDCGGSCPNACPSIP